MVSRRIFSAVAAVASMSMLAACGGNGESAECEEQAEENFTSDLVFATGGTAGVYYPFGGELAAIYEDQIDDVSVNYVESGGGSRKRRTDLSRRMAAWF